MAKRIDLAGHVFGYLTTKPKALGGADNGSCAATRTVALIEGEKDED